MLFSGVFLRFFYGLVDGGALRTVKSWKRPLHLRQPDWQQEMGLSQVIRCRAFHGGHSPPTFSRSLPGPPKPARNATDRAAREKPHQAATWLALQPTLSR
jgi:hypothetical protein